MKTILILASCLLFKVTHKEKIDNGYKYEVNCINYPEFGIIYSSKEYKVGDTIKIQNKH